MNGYEYEYVCVKRIAWFWAQEERKQREEEGMFSREHSEVSSCLLDYTEKLFSSTYLITALRPP